MVSFLLTSGSAMPFQNGFHDRVFLLQRHRFGPTSTLVATEVFSIKSTAIARHRFFDGLAKTCKRLLVQLSTLRGVSLRLGIVCQTFQTVDLASMTSFRPWYGKPRYCSFL